MSTISVRPTAPPLPGTVPRIFSWRFIAPILVWAAIFVLPNPATLSLGAWRYFALFAGVIVALILEPIPTAAVGFVGVTLAVILGYVTASPADSIAWGLTGFSDTTVWLIFGAFVFSLGYEKTGLGRRVALFLVRLLGGRTLGLGYAITIADLIIAPFTPSNTGRSAGTIFPIIRNIPTLYGSEPGDTARKFGAYIMWTAFAATAITSSMFLTGLAPNPLALTLVKQTVKLDISWSQWFMGFLPMGVLLLVLMPLIIYFIYPPQIKTSKEVPVWAKQELSKMGAISTREVMMGALVLIALGLWIFGGSYVNATAVVLIVISLMILSRIVTWEDITSHKQAWNVLVWFATLVTLASGLSRVGFVSWVAKGVAASLTGLSPLVILGLLVAFFFIVHYMFASLTAHTTAVLPVVLAAGAAIPGMPVTVLALLLVYSLGLMGVITPYATGPAPVYYASGYISRKDFWLLGLIMGILYLAALLVIGMPYLLNFTP